MSATSPAVVPPLVEGEGDVHVWRFETCLATVASLAASLSCDELVRAERLPWRARARFCHARAMLRRILGLYLRRPAESLEFTYGDRGKPSVGDGVAFSLSHAASRSLLAVTRTGMVGVDMEEVRSFSGMARVTERCFSRDEAAAVLAVSEPERTRRFLACWTRKEAYLKAIGTGLSAPLAAVDVMGADGSPRLLPPEGFRRELEFVDLDLGPGFASALALSPGVDRISFVDMELP